MTALALFLHALTPVHVGTGQAVGVIDLPIARERATNWPVLPASGVKGVFRDEAERNNIGSINQLFGFAADTGSSTGQAGLLCFSDQRLLCLAVRSFYGTFAYVTSPLVLNRLKRDLEMAGFKNLTFLHQIPSTTDKALITPNSKIAQNSKLYLEDLDLDTDHHQQVQSLAEGLGNILFGDEKDLFTERFAVVPEDVFSFLCETATEVTARVRLEDNVKTVTSGGLWYEEAVPTESIFAGVVLWPDNEKTTPAHSLFQNVKRVQLGGKASVGRGICRVIAYSNGAASQKEA